MTVPHQRTSMAWSIHAAETQFRWSLGSRTDYLGNSGTAWHTPGVKKVRLNPLYYYKNTASVRFRSWKHGFNEVLPCWTAVLLRARSPLQAGVGGYMCVLILYQYSPTTGGFCFGPWNPNPQAVGAHGRELVGGAGIFSASMNLNHQPILPHPSCHFKTWSHQIVFWDNLKSSDRFFSQIPQPSSSNQKKTHDDFSQKKQQVFICLVSFKLFFRFCSCWTLRLDEMRLREKRQWIARKRREDKREESFGRWKAWKNGKGKKKGRENVGKLGKDWSVKGQRFFLWFFQKAGLLLSGK